MSYTNPEWGKIEGDIRDQQDLKLPLTPQMFGAKGDGVTDDTIAIQAAIDSLYLNSGTLFFPKGTYIVNLDIRFNGSGSFKEGDITIEGEQGSIIKKGSSFPADGYLFQFRKSNNVDVKNLIFIGKTPTINLANFGDNGIIFNSFENARVTGCRFKDFGDGFIKVSSTSINNTPTAVESRKIFVNNNFFENCFQTSTTPGGCSQYILSNNYFSNSRIKFASRYNVADRIIISNNIISDITGITSPIEIVGYSNVLMSGNTVINSESVALNIYTNTNAVDNLISENYQITGNKFINTKGGIRVDNSTFTNGYKNLFKNLVIENNSFLGTYDNPSVYLINGSYQGVYINNNIIENTNSLGISIIINSDSTMNLEDNISIFNNSIKAINSYAIRVSSSLSENRKLKNVSITNNPTLYGAIYLSNIDSPTFDDNNVKLTVPANICQVDNLSNSIFKLNRFVYSDTNGFNFINCDNIDFSLNNTEGTVQNYHLRYDATCTGTIKDINNTFAGVVFRNANALVITSGTGTPEGVVQAGIGSIYQQLNGALWYKNTGISNTGWVTLLSTGGAALGSSSIGTTNGNLTLLANAVNFLIDQVGVSISSNIIKNRTSLNNGYIDLNNSGVRITGSTGSTAAAEINNVGTGLALVIRKAASAVASFTADGIFDSPTIIPNIDFGSVPPQDRLAAPTTFTFTGASLGDIVLVQGPNTGLDYKGYVTSTDTITIYACNNTTSAIDPTSGSFKITIIK